MQPNVLTKRFIRCPHCDKGEHTVEHLFEDQDRSFGRWRCHDCNHEFSGVAKQDGTIEITKVVPSDSQPMLCLLRFRDLYLVVNSYTKPKQDDRDDWYDYLFHSHQCPSNILGSVEEVYDPAEGRDPHGQIRFIAAVPDAGQDVGKECGTVEELFRYFHTDGTEAPTNWPEDQHGLIPFIAAMQYAYRKARSPSA